MGYVRFVSKVDVTPEIMAEAFWAMDTTEQARFFAALAKETNKTLAEYEATPKHLRSGYPGDYGEMQWCLMKDEVFADPEARRQYMALSAWAFDFIPLRTEY